MRIIIALVLLASCSPAARFDRLIKKHPELVKRMDTTIRVKVTVYKTDTFYVKGDTIIREANLDSLTSSFSELYSDSLYSISMSLDSLKKIRAKVVFKPRTLTKLDTIYVDKVITVPAKVVEVQNDRWKHPFFITWIVIMLSIALKKLWK
jgi:hypothetical protein